MDTIIELFAKAQGGLFEALVQPTMFAVGLAGFLDHGHVGTGWFLVGLLQLLVIVLVIGPRERRRPVEVVSDRSTVRTDVRYTLIHRLGLFRWLRRWGERLFVSPRFHQLHLSMGIGHESRPAGKMGARAVINGAPAPLGGHNFGVLFPWWDMLFGTADVTLQFAPSGMRNQVEQGVDYGRGFWAQQWHGVQRLWTQP